MPAAKKALSLCALVALCCLLAGSPALAAGPTGVDPVSWQRAGAVLSFDARHPAWVTGWADSSGHGNDLHTGSWAGSPRYIADGLNGQPILGFGKGQGTSASDQLHWSPCPLAGAEAATGLIVVRAFEDSQGGGGDVWNLGAYGPPNAWSPPEIWEDFGSAMRPLLISDRWSSRHAPDAPPLRTPSAEFGEWCIYAVTIGPEEGKIVMRGYLNGVLKQAAGGLTMGWNETSTVGDFGNSATVMDVAEILLYDRVLSASEMGAVVAYLGEKFGLCVAPPTFEPDGGVRENAQTVTVTCATDGATIRYTTDGSDPGESNGRVIASGGSVAIKADTILKARAWKAGLPRSEIRKAVYAFAPIPRAGLVAWNKAGFGLSFDAGHADWVTGWADASNHGNDLVKGPWAGAPIYKPNLLKGLPVLGFGVGQGTSCCDELYYVARHYAGAYQEPTGLPACPLLGAEAATGIIVVQVFRNSHDPPYGGQVWDLGAWGGPNAFSPPEIWDDFGNTTRPMLINDASLAFGEWYVYGATIEGPPGSAVMTGYINGVLKGTVGGLTVGFYEVSVGDFNPIAHNATSVMNIAEILLYDRALSADEMSAVTRYLEERFGLRLPQAAAEARDRGAPR